MEIKKDEIEKIINEKIKHYSNLYGSVFKSAVIEILSLEKLLNPEKEQKRSRLIPLIKWEKYHTDYTTRALRQYYFYREQNGFEECIEYGGNNGGRILIDEDKFYEWHKKRSELKKSKCL